MRGHFCLNGSFQRKSCTEIVWMKKEQTLHFAETMENTLKILFPSFPWSICLYHSHFCLNLVLGILVSSTLPNICYWWNTEVKCRFREQLILSQSKQKRKALRHSCIWWVWSRTLRQKFPFHSFVLPEEKLISPVWIQTNSIKGRKFHDECKGEQNFILYFSIYDATAPKIVFRYDRSSKIVVVVLFFPSFLLIIEGARWYTHQSRVNRNF